MDFTIFFQRMQYDEQVARINKKGHGRPWSAMTIRAINGRNLYCCVFGGRAERRPRCGGHSWPDDIL